MLPTGISRYQHSVAPVTLNQLRGKKESHKGQRDILNQLGGWAPTLYYWAQRNYRSKRLDPSTVEFDQQAIVELIMIAFIYGANWFWNESILTTRVNEEGKKRVMKELLDDPEKLQGEMERFVESKEARRPKIQHDFRQVIHEWW